jgi:hypothetical protein
MKKYITFWPFSLNLAVYDVNCSIFWSITLNGNLFGAELHYIGSKRLFGANPAGVQVPRQLGERLQSCPGVAD